MRAVTENNRCDLDHNTITYLVNAVRRRRQYDRKEKKVQKGFASVIVTFWFVIPNRILPSHSVDTKAPSFSVPGDAR